MPTPPPDPLSDPQAHTEAEVRGPYDDLFDDDTTSNFVLPAGVSDAWSDVDSLHDFDASGCTQAGDEILPLGASVFTPSVTTVASSSLLCFPDLARSSSCHQQYFFTSNDANTAAPITPVPGKDWHGLTFGAFVPNPHSVSVSPSTAWSSRSNSTIGSTSTGDFVYSSTWHHDHHHLSDFPSAQAGPHVIHFSQNQFPSLVGTDANALSGQTHLIESIHQNYPQAMRMMNTSKMEGVVQSRFLCSPSSTYRPDKTSVPETGCTTWSQQHNDKISAASAEMDYSKPTASIKNTPTAEPKKKNPRKRTDNYDPTLPVPPLSTYNFFFRWERKRILEDVNNVDPPRYWEWNAGFQRNLLEQHWTQHRTVKRKVSIGSSALPATLSHLTHQSNDLIRFLYFNSIARVMAKLPLQISQRGMYSLS